MMTKSVSGLSGANVVDLRGSEAWLKDFIAAAGHLRDGAPSYSETRQRWRAVQEYLRSRSADDNEIRQWGAFAAGVPKATRPNRPPAGSRPLPDPAALEMSLHQLYYYAGLDHTLALYSGHLGDHEKYGRLFAYLPQRTWYSVITDAPQTRTEALRPQNYAVQIRRQHPRKQGSWTEIGQIVCNFQRHPDGVISLKLGSPDLPRELEPWCTDRLLDRWFDVLMHDNVVLVPPLDRVVALADFRNRPT